MTALAKVLTRASGIEISAEILRAIAIFCGAALLFGLVVATYGIDLSPGFFCLFSGLSYFKVVNVFFESQPNPVVLFMTAAITAAAKTDDPGG